MIAGEVVARLRQRLSRAVHRQHRRGAARERIEAETAGVAKTVEHLAPLAEFADALAVVALVEIKAGLVPRGHIHAVGEAVLAQLHAGARQGAVKHAALRGQSLEFAHIGIRALVHAGAAGQLAHGVGELAAPALGARGQQLQHDHVAVAIHDDPGQAVRFAVHDAHRVAVVPRAAAVRVPPAPGAGAHAANRRRCARLRASSTRARGSATPGYRRPRRGIRRQPRAPPRYRPLQGRPAPAPPRPRKSRDGGAGATSRDRA